MKPLQIYMGWDPREIVAYDVARESMWRRTQHQLQIIPLKLAHLPALTRPIERRGAQMWDMISDAPMSTEFAISRFMVPHLTKEGWALFTDCDILCWEDIADLFSLADKRFAVMVVKHPSAFTDTLSTKMDGQLQTFYARKNWSSVILWNCAHPAHKRLTLEVINSLPGRDLHAFSWLSDDEIGELPQKWNWLIDVTPATSVPTRKEGIWHYTLGGPWLPNWGRADTPEDEEWRTEACRL